FRVVAAQLYSMPAGGERPANALWNAALHVDIAPVESHLGEARRLHRGLDVHTVVDHIGDELGMRLRLIEAAHDAEGDPLLTALHEPRNDRVQRTLVAGQR